MTGPDEQSDLRESFEAMTRAFGLDLPPDRLAELVKRFGDFVTKFDEVWRIDPGEHEPVALTFDDEVTAR